MRITVTIGLGLALAANGLLMLLDPAGWYALAPGVPETGPLNLHFVRDIGCAYILTGLALAGLAFNERVRCMRSFTSPTVSTGGCTRTMSSPTSFPCMRRPRSLSGLSFCPPPSQGVCPC
jgi:hypothetical protein